MEEALESGPIACSLGPADLAKRRRHWRRLRARGTLSVESTSRGLRLEFPGEPGIEAELRELVALERVCCAFADWSLRGDSDRLVLEVGGRTDEGVAAVQAMFGTSPVTRRAPARHGRSGSSTSG